MSTAPPEPVPDPLVGVELNGYQIRSVMAEGGMGKVYLAVHPLVGAKAAIKVMLPQWAADHEQSERFVREARVLATLNHDRILKIMGFGNLPDGRQYMITEHLEGAPLERIIERESPMSPTKALALLDQVLDALSAAHAAGVVHRDLKPANVIVKTVGTERKVKLLDFGLARARVLQASVDPSQPLNKASQVMGTPEYMAPEQCRGFAPTPASDLYSVGVMLFELLTHRLPFIATEVIEMMRHHVSSPPPRAGVLVPSIPQSLDDLVAQLLSKAPEERGAPAERVRKILHNIQRELEETEVVPPAAAGAKRKMSTEELQKAAEASRAEAARQGPTPGESGVRAAKPMQVLSDRSGSDPALRNPLLAGRPATDPRLRLPSQDELARAAAKPMPLLSDRPGTDPKLRNPLMATRPATDPRMRLPSQDELARAAAQPMQVLTDRVGTDPRLRNPLMATRPATDPRMRLPSAAELARAGESAARDAAPAPARPSAPTPAHGAPAASPSMGSPSPASGQPPRVDPAYAAALEKAQPQVRRSGAGFAVLFVLSLAVAGLGGAGMERFLASKRAPAVAAVSPPAAVGKGAPIAPAPQQGTAPADLAAAPAADAGAAAVADAEKKVEAMQKVEAEQKVEPRASPAERDPQQVCRDVPQWRAELLGNVRTIIGVYKQKHPKGSQEKPPLSALVSLRNQGLAAADVPACVKVQKAIDAWELAHNK